jgi:hypothetical protein
VQESAGKRSRGSSVGHGGSAFGGDQDAMVFQEDSMDTGESGATDDAKLEVYHFILNS